MHSCRSPLEAPCLPSKIISKRNTDQNNNEKVKGILHSGASEEASGEHLPVSRSCSRLLFVSAYL